MASVKRILGFYACGVIRRADFGGYALKLHNKLDLPLCAMSANQEPVECVEHVEVMRASNTPP
jgi:hypothetical protein